MSEAGKGSERLPRLVIFDVDGTLQDSLRWWAGVARAGVAALAQRLAIPIPTPGDELACSVVGKPDPEIWICLLPEALAPHWALLRDCIIPLETEVLFGGEDYLFPGTRELLTGLRREGVKIALASNCRQQYFDAVLDGQGLRAYVDKPYCLDSEGVRDKSDMLGRALVEFGTRDAIMVGDRENDAIAAKKHGLPFVLRTGYLSRDELVADAYAANQAEIGAAIRRLGAPLMR